VAGVLAHEVAHIAQRHAASQLTKGIVANLGLGLLGAVLGNGGGAGAAQVAAGFLTNGIFLNGKRVRRHKLQPGDIVKLGMHDLTYTRADLPGAAGDDTRVTQTTVLQPSDYDDEGDDEADDRDDDERDGPSYSSIARGS